jgi:hypothetical protein
VDRFLIEWNQGLASADSGKINDWPIFGSAIFVETNRSIESGPLT